VIDLIGEYDVDSGGEGRSGISVESLLYGVYTMHACMSYTVFFLSDRKKNVF
jgi:hypothetical protein